MKEYCCGCGRLIKKGQTAVKKEDGKVYHADCL